MKQFRQTHAFHGQLSVRMYVFKPNYCNICSYRSVHMIISIFIEDYN
jgi:hypothetical protein